MSNSISIDNKPFIYATPILIDFSISMAYKTKFLGERTKLISTTFN